MISPSHARRRGLDAAGRVVLEECRFIARQRARLDVREAEVVSRGLSLGVPVTWMSVDLGYAATTLGMRLAKEGRNAL